MLDSPRVLPQRFYLRDTITVARDLLGKVLRVRDDVFRSGVIVETEAYLRDDPACHAFNGPTKRNRSMWQEPGTVYVYKIHSVYCVNAVTNKGEAVLIRALQPLENVSSSTKGPGRLCRALNITKGKHDGLSLTGPEIQVVDYDFGRFGVCISQRIGISRAKELPLRFFISGSKFVGHKSSITVVSEKGNFSEHLSGACEDPDTSVETR